MEAIISKGITTASNTTYILNSSLQSFSQDYDLDSHSTYAVCVHFIHLRRDLQFNVDSEPQIFEKLFMALSFTLRVFARNLPQKYFFFLMSDIGFESWFNV